MDEFRKITIAQWEGSKCEGNSFSSHHSTFNLDSFVKHIKMHKAPAKESGQILFIFIMEGKEYLLKS